MSGKPKIISVQPQPVDLYLYAGDDVHIDVAPTDPATGAPIDLTGVTAKAQIRASAGAPDPPAANFATAVSTNTITLSLDAAITATLPSRGVWDCQVTWSNGDVTTLFAGQVYVGADVTR